MRIEIRQLENRDHFVTPMVMMVEGVLNGSGGALFYPGDEIEASVQAWNAKPIIIFHPNFLTSGAAGSPTIFNKQKVGSIFGTKFSDGRLTAEAWLSIERLEKLDDRVLVSIQNNRMMELSTGLFVDTEIRQGEWNGKPYSAIARNYRPDHLALLPDPDLVGACSIEHGCGLIRNLEEGETPLALPSTEF